VEWRSFSRRDVARSHESDEIIMKQGKAINFTCVKGKLGKYFFQGFVSCGT
jgi:hypothetical protein